MTFGKRLQQLMDHKKINQVDAAKGVGVDRSRFNLLLNDKVGTPRRETLQKISAFFGCNIEWLATETGDPFPSEKPISEAEKLVKNYGKKRSVTKSYSSGWKNYPTVPAKAETKEAEAQPPPQVPPAIPDQLILRFQHIFEFLEECYGEDVVAINDFLARLDKEFLQNDPDYQFWLEERRKAVEARIKKRGGESGLPEKKSAKGNK